MMDYVWRWAKTKMCPVNYPLAKYKGKLCKVLVRGSRNSCLVEFEDGTRHVVSRNAIKKSSLGRER